MELFVEHGGKILPEVKRSGRHAGVELPLND